MWHDSDIPCYNAGTMWMTVTGCALGIAAGVRHALEPDHLAAVSAMVAGGASQTRGTLRFAAAWGVGHGLVLVGVGAVLFALRARMPPTLADGFELLVALMLVALGVRGLHQARGAEAHAAGAHTHELPRATSVTALPFFVGTLHGLAGSGGLTAAVAAEQPTVGLGLLTMVLYGLGAAVGMVTLAAVATLPLQTRAVGKRLLRGVSVASSFASLAVGVAWAAPVLHRMVLAAA